MRPFIVRALQCFYKHDGDDLIKQPANEADSQAVASDRLPRVSKESCFLLPLLNVESHVNK